MLNTDAGCRRLFFVAAFYNLILGFMHLVFYSRIAAIMRDAGTAQQTGRIQPDGHSACDGFRSGLLYGKSGPLWPYGHCAVGNHWERRCFSAVSVSFDCLGAACALFSHRCRRPYICSSFLEISDIRTWREKA